MAGVKVTDLTTLGTADANDVMYIVDSSSNQSKQIEVQNIYSGMPQFESGAFTPTVTNETPNTTTINMNGGFYQRVDSIVTMSFFFEINFGVSDSSVTFNIDLPIASDFTNIKDIVGVFTPNDYIDYNGGQIVANTSSNLGEITVNGTAGSTITYVWAMVQYQIM